MIEAIKQMYGLFTRRDKRISFVLFFTMLVMGLLEVTGIALVVPFMLVVSDPDAIENHKKIAWLYQHLPFSTPHWFLFFLGVLVLTVLVFGNAFSAFTSWALIKFSSMQEYKLSTRLLSKYLHQPYHFFLQRNSAELTKNILAEVSTVSNNLLMPALQLLSRSVVVVSILLLLLVIDSSLAIMMALVLGGSYTLVYAVLRKLLTRYGKMEIDNNEARYKIAHEGIGGIKDVKLLGIEQSILARYQAPARRLARARALNLIMAMLPRYFLESIAFGGIILMVLYLLAVKKVFGQVIPLLSLYAFAGYRLMPSLQNIFKSMAQVKSNIPRLEVLCRDFHHGEKIPVLVKVSPLSFQHQITLHDVGFHYQNVKDNVFSHLDLTIKSNTTVGFVGSTGAGKTTIVDLILGLLQATQGQITIDDVVLSSDNLRAWQMNLGYVPQHIYLADDTVTRNIAFGVPDDDIDQATVTEAANIANLHDFIQTLPQEYETFVGERGVRLSGGQRQRIGIARALYRQPKVLILDEATSALDNITENSILDSVQNLAHQKTILMIAHRLSTVKLCDVIYVLEQGRIVGQGSYDELMASNEYFQKLAMVNKTG